MSSRERVNGAVSGVVALTASNSDLADGMAKGLWADSACTVEIVDGHGNDVTGFPLIPGFNPIFVSKVKAISDTANVWACY